MKRLLFYCLVFTSLFSCKNEDIIPSSSKIIDVNTEAKETISSQFIEVVDKNFRPSCKNPENIIGRVENVGGVLKFESIVHYENCLKCLEDAMEDHLTNFENKYPNKTSEELDSIEDAIEFRYFKPLELFEEAKAFSSRRSLIEDQISSWLNRMGEEFNPENDPDEFDSFSEEERTLMNKHGVLNINGKVLNLIDMVEVEVLTRDPDGCRRFNKTTEYEEYVTDRRIKAKLANYSYPWKVKIKSKIVHYRKRRRNWRRRRGLIATACLGTHALNNCVGSEDLGDFASYRNRRSRKAKRTVWGVESWRQHRCAQQNGNYGVIHDNVEYIYNLNH